MLGMLIWDKDRLAPFYNEVLMGFLFRYIILPLVIILLGAIIVNFFFLGHIEGVKGNFSSLEWDGGYKVVCHFEIKNKGLFSVNSEKIQLEIPEYAKIQDIVIEEGDRHQYKLVSGGKNRNYVVFEVDGLDGRKRIKGTITFFQSKKWTKDLSPIFFSE